MSLQQRGLPASRRAEQGDDLAPRDAERRGVDGGDVAETLRHAVESDHRAVHVRGTLHPLGSWPSRDDRRADAADTLAGVPYAEIFPLVTARALARAFTYRVTGRGGARGRARDRARRPARARCRRRGRRRASGRASTSRTRERSSIASRPRSSSSRSGLPTTTAPRPRARWRSSRRMRPRDVARGASRRRGTPSAASPSPTSSPRRSGRRSRASSARSTASGGHVLLHGPTGSGKTEVYLQAAAAALERGRGVIVLVPEIALTPQTVGRFRARFGDRVAVLHSALTDAERRDERERISLGEAPVVVGARSAIFAPVDRLGLVVVDEEHDASFKQESDPRYDARTVAAKRAALEGAVAVYGSATPRAESWSRLERLGAAGADRRADADREARRPSPRGRVSAVCAAARGALRRVASAAAARSCSSTAAASRARSTAGRAGRRAAAGAATSR